MICRDACATPLYLEKQIYKSFRRIRWLEERFSDGEFDPGSERTLAAWIRHASRTGLLGRILRVKALYESGELVRNTWATCPYVWDSPSKEGVMPDVVVPLLRDCLKVGTSLRRGLPHMDGPASYQLVGEGMAHQGVDG